MLIIQIAAGIILGFILLGLIQAEEFWGCLGIGVLIVSGLIALVVGFYFLKGHIEEVSAFGLGIVCIYFFIKWGLSTKGKIDIQKETTIVNESLQGAIHEAEGNRFRICSKCREKNNPTFINCWKCKNPL